MMIRMEGRRQGEKSPPRKSTRNRNNDQLKRLQLISKLYLNKRNFLKLKELGIDYELGQWKGMILLKILDKIIII